MDAAVFSAINGAHAPWLDQVMLLVTSLGNFAGVWFITAVGMLVVPRLRAAAFRMVLAVALTQWLTSGVVKPLVGRPRPYVANVVSARTIEPSPATGSSFPSGHTATAVAGAIAGARVVPGAGPVLWTLATAIAYSRVYVGVHYPSDVAAGALFGMLCAFFVLGGRHPSAFTAPFARGPAAGGVQSVP